MANLKIRVFRGDDEHPETTITIPSGILKVASRLVPRQATAALQDKGIDLDEIIRLSENPDVSGTLVEIEEHKKDQRVVISLE